MARKGVAVSQIIMLVLGILVLAVVAFLLYSNFVTSGGTLSAEQCRAAVTRACTSCSIASGGTSVQCDATYLDSIGAKCAAEGKVTGATADLGGDGKTYIPAGTLSCDQYVGGLPPVPSQ